MKDKLRFDRAIKALVSAFFDGTLAKGDCAACAVGNMVAAGYGKKVFIDDENEFYCPTHNQSWADVFISSLLGNHFEISNYTGLAKENIDITGYSVLELSLVEIEFEKNTFIYIDEYCLHTKEQIMQDQYNGLMAVVEVLCEIEGIENVSEYKEMFAYKV